MANEVKVTACRPDMRGGWLCVLACGCQVYVDVKRRPRELDHVCEPEPPILPDPPDHVEFETRYADQEHANEED